MRNTKLTRSMILSTMSFVVILLGLINPSSTIDININIMVSNIFMLGAIIF